MMLLSFVGSARAADQPAGANVVATADGSVVIHPIEHASFVMEWNGKVIAVDPVGGVDAVADLPEAGMVLVTDIHGDHLSADTIAAVTSDSASVICPPAVAEKLPDDFSTVVIANGESTTWQGITVEAVPAYNLDPDKQQFHPKGRGNGYVVTLGGARIYISGDTEDIPEMRALENIDAAFVCMNLPYTMTVAAAADAVLEFKPKVVFPYHFRGKGGMSDLGAFRDAVAKNPAIEVRVLAWY
jgi:L-ascorbate metabolism protein UlaG (beta-lactamase superfamily)